MRRVEVGRGARTAMILGVMIAAALAASAGLVLSWAGRPAATARAARATHRPPATAPARRTVRRRPAAPAPVPVSMPATTVLATVLETTDRYAGPGRLADGTVPATWYDRPSVLPVIATRPGWVRVRLAQRPNQSTAWLPDSDVALTSTSYGIVVNLATTHLSLYHHGRLVFSAPAGVGATDDPTPTGEYFVAFDEPPPGPGYGAFIMVTSDHSESISDWEGSGDAVIGIHGPLGDDAEIGTAGAKISHGCIRLHDQALDRLADVPAGTPVDVVS